MINGYWHFAIAPWYRGEGRFGGADTNYRFGSPDILIPAKLISDLGI
jgi:hypothetical protein